MVSVLTLAENYRKGPHDIGPTATLFKFFNIRGLVPFSLIYR